MLLTPAGGDGAGTAAEARFWAAVEGADLAGPGRDAGGGGPGAAGRGAAGAVLVAAAGAGPVGDRELAVPDHLGAGARTGPGGAVRDLADSDPAPEWPARTSPTGCRRALEAHGAGVVVAGTATEDTERSRLSALITALRAALPELCGCCLAAGVDESPLAGYPAVSAGLAGTLALVQALGDAGRERAAVGADPGGGRGRVRATCWPVRCRRRRAGWRGWPPRSTRTGGAAWSTSAGAGRAGRGAAVRGAGRVRGGSGGDRGCGGRWRGGWCGPRCPAEAEPWVPRGSGAGDGRDRGAGRARGALAGRAGRAARGAGQPVRPGQPRHRRPLPRAWPRPGPGWRCSPVTRRERADVAGLLTRVAAGGPPLTAVVHAAGVLDDGVLDGAGPETGWPRCWRRRRRARRTWTS